MFTGYRALVLSLAVLALAALGAAAWRSPQTFPAALQRAADGHDLAKIDAMVDFRALGADLRAALRPTLSKAVSDELSEGRLSGPDAARLAGAADAIVAQAADQIALQAANPRALAAALRGEPVSVTALGRESLPLDDFFPKDAGGRRFDISTHPVGLMRYMIDLKARRGASTAHVELVRTGLFSWRAERMDAVLVIAAPTGPPQVAAAPPPPPVPPPPDTNLSAPTKVGDCVVTSVKEVTSRLDGVPGSGTDIVYADGIAQVSYDQEPAADASRAGDQVRLCLVSLPTGCPPGDDRGKVYDAENLRTGGRWSLPDSEHMCGGA